MLSTKPRNFFQLKDDSQLIEQLRALGDPMRLRILRMLPRNPDCKHANNVSQLAERLGVCQPTVSHHLKALKQAGLAQSRKMCRDVFYWIVPEQADAVVERLRETLQRGPADS